MFALIATIAKFLAGLIDFAQQIVAARNKDQDMEAGRLAEQARQQLTKEKDEAIAKVVDAQPTPADKHRILDGLRSPDGDASR